MNSGGLLPAISSPSTKTFWHRPASHLLMMASGFAGLGYQIVWTKQCALWLGHEAPAVFAVVAAFFGGLAIGALLLGQRIERSQRPASWYAGCEFIIAVWSLVLALCMSPFSNWLLDIIGVQPTPLWQWTVAFFGTFLLLLPATAAMGATLPAMERITALMRSEQRSIAALYASNTFGAVIGVIAIAFWLIPHLGLLRTAGICISLNIFCGSTALLLFSRLSFSQHSIVQNLVATTRKISAQRVALTRLAATGLLGIGYEVLVVRVLSQVAEDTVYTFAMLLAVYLIGSAVGAAIYQGRFAHRSSCSEKNDEKLSQQLLAALAMACLLGTASLWAAEDVKAWELQTFTATMTTALIAEATLALLAFGLPTLIMGALFSHLSARAIASGSSCGRALSANTLGAALAPLLFGVIAFPLLGPKLSLLLISAGYLALIGWRQQSRYLMLIPAGIALAISIWAPPLAFIEIPDGGNVVSYQEGTMAAVSIVEDADGVSRLRINNRQQEGSSSSVRVDARQALLPVLLHSAPKLHREPKLHGAPQQILFLGLGTGITATAAAGDPALQVDAVELLPEVITSSHHFTQAFDSAASARLHLIAADARRYVRTSEKQYDVIIADNFHPARSGSGSLYTVEHFAAVRHRLATDGLFCQWLPLHQLDLETLRHIVQSFRVIYPDGWAMIANNSLETPVLGLVGRNGPQRFDINVLQQRLKKITAPERSTSLGIEDEFALLGSFVAGPKALQQFAGDVQANTDDFPIVEYRAPRITYAPDSLPRDRLISLLQQFYIEPNELITDSADTNNSRRLAAYWHARNQFIESGRAVQPSRNVQEMLAQVREPLLAVLRISPDFRPAYDPLLMMANSLARSDMSGARALLQELAQVQPARPEAESVLRKLHALPQ